MMRHPGWLFVGLAAGAGCGTAVAPAPSTPPVASTSAAPAASSAPPPPAASSAPAPKKMLPPAADAKPPADRGHASCKKGEAAGCDQLAEYWGLREILPPGREAEARADGEALKEACDRGISSACMGYALMLKYGTATGKRDNDAAKPYWARLKELGDLNGFRDKPSEDGKAALGKVAQECEQGRTRSCNQAGWAAYNGVQRDKSIQDAFDAYAEACRLGSSLGCRWAGHYAHVYAEVKNLAESERMLRRSCDGQNPGGCAELGNFLDAERQGQGALEHFEKACEGGSRDGCMSAGKKLLAAGKEKRPGAVERLKKACDAEQEEACDILGPLLEKGDGAKRDLDGATAAYQRGCQGKQEASCEALSRLLGAGKSEKCVLDPKKPPKIGDKAVKTLRDACKLSPGAPWCKGVASCTTP